MTSNLGKGEMPDLTALVIGISGIADRCGVADVTVRGWRNRYDDFPQPAGYLSRHEGPGSSPWWNWPEVEAWLADHPHLGGAT